MDKFLIKGPNILNGTVKIGGAKNAVLPLMTACIIHPGEYILNNVPILRDTMTMAKLLEMVGAKVEINGNSFLIDTKNCNTPYAPYELVSTMRASFYVLGPFMSRFKEAQVSLPGGCAWGPRPVDFHIKALEKMGAKINLDGGYINAKGELSGTDIIFDKSSVGATGNVMMAAINASGVTKIENSAKEPEIDCLMKFLNLMGGNIKRDKMGNIIIKGSNNLKDKIEFDVIPDRIEAGTFMIATAMCKGKVELLNVNPSHLSIVTDKLIQCGARIDIKESSLVVEMKNRPKPIDMSTLIYPGFPTDLQAQWMALMTIADGSSKVIDNIYTDRFTHVAELERLGAKIDLDNNLATITGVNQLYGAQVMSTDIRASASLLIAALSSIGDTEISRIYHIDRGYENIEQKFKNLNSNIIRTV
ncbi:MAG: UDP-N-acetylglucosamine 1-carboxyvinyltransferase [Candidatus Marinimicrobia bacterium]|nr:UDP-N-acetylglucosamine 1-carboxyvinyltransferase [Candidatus Neomarinimicrobiota bacterium]|tara:strand:+ start:324 stop:1574 length:1251 start_codon:yes stop_codon:yes gene_type:complete